MIENRGIGEQNMDQLYDQFMIFSSDQKSHFTPKKDLGHLTTMPTLRFSNIILVDLNIPPPDKIGTI